MPAASLGLDVLSAGDVIAVGVCVNDGDSEAGQGGQKGWSGWGPHAAVFGKTPSETGLVTLSDTPLDDACTGLDAKRQNALNIYYNVGCIQAEETHDFLDEINPDSITWVGNSIQDRETPDGASNVQFVDLGLVFAETGRVVSWDLYTGRAGRQALQVWRPIKTRQGRTAQAESVNTNFLFPLTEDACSSVAVAAGVELGGVGYDFAGDYGNKGCYFYTHGVYAGHAYFGTGGSDAQMQEGAKGDAERFPAQGAVGAGATADDARITETGTSGLSVWRPVEPPAKLVRDDMLFDAMKKSITLDGLFVGACRNPVSLCAHDCADG